MRGKKNFLIRWFERQAQAQAKEGEADEAGKTLLVYLDVKRKSGVQERMLHRYDEYSMEKLRARIFWLLTAKVSTKWSLITYTKVK